MKDMEMKRIVVAVDGFSSCGKSTMAKDLAREIGYSYIDSGAMYRAVTLYAIRNNFFKDNMLDIHSLEKNMGRIKITFSVNSETGYTETFLNGTNIERDIRGMEVAGYVSGIAAIPFVRKALVEQQRSMGETRGIVMDGRDIGTVVFPDAELKIFVTASPEIRALRRFDELKAKNENVSFEEILENIKSRDYQDKSRGISPLRKAEDAIELDNTNMTVSEQKIWLLKQYNLVINNDGD